jgi:hypothetical protein
MNVRPGLSREDLHADHQRWWSDLCSWQEDVRDFERRMEEVLAQPQTDDVRAQAEQFQDRLIREQEVIDELQHLVKTHEASLAAKARELPHGSASAPHADHDELRERMLTAAHLHTSLRDEFRTWAAHHRH